jgi:TolB protein
MTQTLKIALKWLLCGGAFMAVVGSAGCARHHAEAVTTEPPQPIPDPYQQQALPPTKLFDNQPQQAESKPPAINIFGEMDGQANAAPHQIGEAGFQQHTYLDEGYDANVSVSPDGKWIVFASTRHSEHPDIYLQRVDGQSVTQLTADDADDAYPTFSPDGKQIAFASTRNGSWDISVMDVDGRNVTQVTNGPAQDLHPSFSPDGKRIAYCSMGGRSGQWEIWTVNLESNEKKMISFGLFPSWSPDKTVDRIAFQRARQRGSRWFSLWTLDLLDGEARRVTEVAVSSNAAVVTPAWSPDGKKLAFGTIVDPQRSVGDKAEGQQDVWTINADGSNKHRVTDGTGANLAPFWARDGRVFFTSDRGGNECVWSANADEKTEAVTATDTRETAP